MADPMQPRREGVTISSELPPVPFILLKKALPKNHIVVGEEPGQLRFLAHQIGAKPEAVERVTDDMLAGFEGRLYTVAAKYKVDLSPELRGRTGMWAAEPITKGSAAINTIVKFAATLLPGRDKIPLKRDVLDRIGDTLTKGRTDDIPGLIWSAVWLLSGDNPPNKLWPDPWESPVDWLDAETKPEVRLHSLHKKLVAYATMVGFGEDAASKLGVKPSQQQHFKGLTLDLARVYRSIALLSRWKQGRMQPYICAVQIATIWS
jgi:hypothetical protein